MANSKETLRGTLENFQTETSVLYQKVIGAAKAYLKDKHCGYSDEEGDYKKVSLSDDGYTLTVPNDDDPNTTDVLHVSALTLDDDGNVLMLVDSVNYDDSDEREIPLTDISTDTAINILSMVC